MARRTRSKRLYPDLRDEQDDGEIPSDSDQGELSALLDESSQSQRLGSPGLSDSARRRLHGWDPPSPQRKSTSNADASDSSRTNITGRAAPPTKRHLDDERKTGLTHSSSIGIRVLVVVIFAVVMCSVYFYLTTSSTGDGTESSEESRWVSAVQLLSNQTRWRHQSRAMWRVTRASVNRMLKQEKQPATVTLLAHETADATVRCLAQRVTEAAREATAAPSTSHLKLDGQVVAGLPDNETKRQMNEKLEQLLNTQPSQQLTTVIVHNTQLLQPLTAMLFHGFCDNENARRRRALFVFDVRVQQPLNDSLDAAQLTQLVEDTLWRRWRHVLSEEVFDALLSRMAGNVAAVGAEQELGSCS